MSDKKTKFNWRGWTTFVVTISFIVDTVSGIILYIAPPGRIANWTNWTVWGLDKEAWGAIHTIFGYVLLIIVAIHLYYNWKVFLSFIWSKLRKALNLKWELIGASLLCLIIFAGTLWEVPPFSSTMELGEFIKESWEENKADVPTAHAELLSIEEFSTKINLPPEQVFDILKSRGYKVRDLQQTLGDIAEANNTSPDKLYEEVKAAGAKPEVPNTIEGSGLGRKSLEKICTERDLPLDQVLQRLQENGIKANPEDKLKEIANAHGLEPIEIFNIIEGKK
jgi:hypothetical protein